MAENENGNTGFESDDGDGVGSLRLEGELTAFRAEFESLAEGVATGEGEHGWIDRGLDLLDKADRALDDGKVEQGWYYLHAAKRLEVYGIEAVGGTEALRGEARELLVEARNAPISWRADAVRERLANADGTVRDTLTGNDLRSAHELLHEGYQRVHMKRQHLQSQFRYLRLWAVITIVALVAVAIAGPASGLLPSPLFEFPAPGDPIADVAGGGPTDSSNGGTPANSSDGSAPGSPGGSLTGPAGFLVYVVLSGMLGGSLFGLRSLRKRPVSGSTPQYLTGRQVTVARIVVGAGSALAVFFFLRSGLLAVDIGTGVDQGPFLISVAFVAGYSERLVHATVESVASRAESEAGTEES